MEEPLALAPEPQQDLDLEPGEVDVLEETETGLAEEEESYVPEETMEINLTEGEKID
ncbi:MAG: hypothetical protein GX853_06710 [Chloroflexi bacterium]|nr:hypothetical protein [Chloroflexota bacterium]